MLSEPLLIQSYNVMNQSIRFSNCQIVTTLKCTRNDTVVSPAP